MWRHDPSGKKQVLLVKQFAHRDSWGIPKGHVHEGESIEDCALREVREEAGVDVLLGERLPDVYAHYGNEKKTVVSYVATLKDHASVERCDHPDSEVAEVRWFDVDNLPKIHVYQQQLLEVAVQKLSVAG